MASTPWTFAAPGPSIGTAGTLTLLDGDTFAVSTSNGDIRIDQPEGMFVLDTRVLSTLLVEIDDQPMEAVSPVSRGPFAMSIVGRPHTAHEPDPKMAILRHRHVGRGLREDVELRNHSTDPLDCVLSITVDADFASLFDIKAGAHDVDVSAVVIEGSDLQLVPTNLDAARLSTHIAFTPRPDTRIGHRSSWHIQLAPGEATTVCTEVSVEVDGRRDHPTSRCGDNIADTPQVQRMQQWQEATVLVESSDDRLELAVRQSLEDLGVLRIFDPAHADRVVVAAGAPWFMALFGRDSILAAWMALLADQRLAAGVLQSLADGQGRTTVAETEEEPGRILHEVRYDHRSIGLLGGSNVYYGTVDATPLFVMLVAEYLRWSNDREMVETLLPAVDRALGWMRTSGDPDGDGFIEYERSHDSGLANQGWKDSWDGVRYGDGRVAEAPIALCEVQAYAFGAHLARAYLADVYGDAELAAEQREVAANLGRAFDKAFWLERKGTFAVGLDADKRPIDSSASNVGHCLWTGIVEPAKAARVAETLSSAELFSGWGLRTLSSANPGYNPLSYHCGSVWPHDTAIAIAGLERYGHHRQAAMLRSGLLDAAAALGGRLPELFAGFGREELPSPVAYPASCAPQAWAAASPLLLVRSMLGMEPDLPNGRVRMTGRLHDSDGELRATDIPLGGGRVDAVVGGASPSLTGLPPTVTVERI